MPKINRNRLLLSGVVAAAVVNVGEGIFGFLMRAEYLSALRSLGVNLESRAAAFLPIVWSIVIGVLAMWLWAMIVPHYGRRFATVLRAASAVWAFSSATFSIAFGSLGLFPVRLSVLMAAWSLAELTVAIAVGSRFYKESPATPAAA